MGPSVERVLTIPLNGSIPLNKMAAMPIYIKKKIFISRTKKTLVLNLGTYDQGHKVYQVYSNDGLRLALFLFMARSNLHPHAFKWGNC